MNLFTATIVFTFSLMHNMLFTAALASSSANITSEADMAEGVFIVASAGTGASGFGSSACIGIHENTALFLTAAHTLLAGPTDLNCSDALPNVFFNNPFTTTDKKSVKFEPTTSILHADFARSPTTRQALQDICLFTVTLPKDVTPPVLPLYTGKGYKTDKGVEAICIGFGNTYGPDDEHKKDDYQRKSFKTKVRYYDVVSHPLLAQPSFSTFQVCTRTFEEISRTKFWGHFALNTVPQIHTLPEEKWLVTQSHAEQQITCGGGHSGGPLVFNTPRGLEISGVLSQSVVTRTTEGTAIVSMHFTPLPDYPWILEALLAFQETGTMPHPLGTTKLEFPTVKG